MYAQETQAMPFKQLIFARIKTEQVEKYKPSEIKYEVVLQTLAKMSWSVRQKRKVKSMFLNIESKAVFNKGIIIRELKSGEVWEVEVLHSTSIAPGYVIANPAFMQQKNYINYSFQRSLFYSWPGALFETFGYKFISKIELSQVSYFANKMKGVEVFVYPRQGYLQIVQTFPAQIDPDARMSAATSIFKKLEEYLDPGQVIIEKETFLPEDFRESMDDGQKIQLLG